MIKKRKLLLSFVLIIGCFCFKFYGQNIDYRTEESPIISWNGVPLFDARLLALAGISSMASEPFAGTVNPAMAAESQKINFAVTINTLNYESFQYWGINQGVIREPGGLSDQKKLISGLAINLPFKNLRVSAGWFLNSLLEFPSFEFVEEYDYESWVYNGDFQGKVNTCFVALASQFGKKFNLGIKLDYIFGKRDLQINEYYNFIYSNNQEFNRIQHRENHKLNYMILSVGANCHITPAWSINTVWVHPLKGNVKRLVTREFYSTLTEERLTISSQEYKNDLFRPKEIHFGTIHTFSTGKSPISRRLTIAAEAIYTFWSDYHYEFFNETLARDMRNTIALAMSAEYAIYKEARDIFFRVGYRFDPQPIKEALTNLNVVSGGVGIRLGKFACDIGLSYFFCSVSGFKQNHLVLNSTLGILLKGGK